jgi:RNA polymerase-binding transcription factor DksA
MSDEADIAGEYVAKLQEAGIDQVRRAASNIPAGYKGYCKECGEYSKRLVKRLCARCRDHFNRLHAKEFHK